MMHAIEGGRLPSAERHFATLKALPVFADVSEEYEEVVGAFLEDFCEPLSTSGGSRSSIERW